MLTSALCEYLRLTVIAESTRSAFRSAVISVVNDNFDDAYASLREGYAGGYNATSGTFLESVDYGDIYGRLDNLLGLDDNHKKLIGTQTEYQIKSLTVEIENAPFAPSDTDSTTPLNAKATIVLEVPIRFGKFTILPLTITLKEVAGFTPKF